MADEIFDELEKTRLKTLFDHIDANHNGFITAQELKGFCNELGHDMTTERANELVAKCDPEGTGKIDWQHFCVGMAVVLAKLKVALIVIALFKTLDTDNTGFITADNLRKIAVEAGADVPPAKIDEIIKKCDKTGDGKISFQEFIDALVTYLRNR